MTSTTLLTSIALTVATLAFGPAALAQPAQGQAQVRSDETRAERDEHRREHRERTHERHTRRAGLAMKTVNNPSLPDQPGYAWQYYSDPRARHAVVISPQGEYYLSRGAGLQQITGPAGQRLPAG